MALSVLEAEPRDAACPADKCVQSVGFTHFLGHALLPDHGEVSNTLTLVVKALYINRITLYPVYKSCYQYRIKQLKKKSQITLPNRSRQTFLQKIIFARQTNQKRKSEITQRNQ